MKIITENKAYVQLNDLSYLMKFMEGNPIPASIIEDVFNGIFICSNENRYDFREFNKPEQIEFFKKLDYSVDYMELKDKSEEEIMAYGDSIAKMANSIANTANELIKRGRSVPIELTSKYEQLEFKLLSVRDFLWFKQGNLKMKLPKINDSKTETKKGLFKRIFKR